MVHRKKTLNDWCKQIHKELSAIPADCSDKQRLEKLLRDYLVVEGAMRTAIDEILSSLPKKLKRKRDVLIEKWTENISMKLVL